MENYDEELHENLFFQAIQHSFSSILDLVSVSGWMVLVPCVDALDGLELTLDNIESHIVKAQEEDPSEFYTLNKKELVIKSGIIVTGERFAENRQAKVLFEELFYNNDDGSYRVLCISQPLQGGHVRTGDPSDLLSANALEVVKSKKPRINVSHLNFEDSCQHLWGYPKGLRIKQQLMKTLLQLTKELNSMMDTTLEELVEKVKKTFEFLVKFLAKSPQFKKPSSHFGMCLALETFIMHRIYRQLIRLIGLHAKERDCNLNKVTRNLTNCARLEHFGINLNKSSLDRTRIVLNSFVRQVTPNAKIYQLRKVFHSLLHSLPTLDGNSMTMTSDELIPVSSFLIAKSNTNNWWSHLLFVRNFCFSVVQFDQELEYFLSTLEASMVYLMSGNIDPLDIWSEVLFPPELGRSAVERPLVDRIFQLVSKKDVDGLEEVKHKIESDKRRGEGSGLCHPLCLCPHCTGGAEERVRSIGQALALFNEAGFTAIHVASMFGYHDIVDWLLNEGANVNERCHLGYTPLHLVSIMGIQVVALLLLSHGANISAADHNGNTALHLAVFHGHFQCAKALVFVDQPRKKLDLNAFNNQQDTALHIAARWGYEDICESLIESGASCLKRNRHHLLPSDLAPNVRLCSLVSRAAGQEGKMAELKTKRRQSLMVNKLERSASLWRSELGLDQSQLSFSESSLSSPTSSSFSSSSSCKAGHAWRLKHAGAHSDSPSRSQNDAKPGASEGLLESHHHGREHEKCTRNPFHPNKGGAATLDFLTQDQHSNLRSPTSLTTGILDETTSDDHANHLVEQLLKGCRDGDIATVKAVLRWSEYEQDHPDAVDVDVTKVKLCHPLCQCRKCVHAQWFLSSARLSPADSEMSEQINVNTRSPEGMSPLHVSCKQGDNDMVRLLLARGASVNLPGASLHGYSPIHLACQQPRMQVVLTLLEFGARLNVGDGRGDTPLHTCIQHHLANHALLLLLFGADANATNKRGDVPLNYALRSSDVRAASLLILFGADIARCANLHKIKGALWTNVVLESILMRNSLKRQSAKAAAERVDDQLPSIDAVERRQSWSHAPRTRNAKLFAAKRSSDDLRVMDYLEVDRRCNRPCR